MKNEGEFKIGPIAFLALAFAALVGMFTWSPAPRVAEATSAPNVSIAEVATYRAAESVAVTVTSSTGDICELRGATGHVGRVKRITVAKPTVAFTLTIVKRSTQDTGGTATTPAMVSLDSSFNPAASLVVNGYTAKPTAGAAVGKVYPPISIGTGDVLTIDFSEKDKQALTIRAGESLALVTDTNTTVGYMIEETEDTH